MEKILMRVNGDPALKRLLRGVDALSVILSAISYAALVTLGFIADWRLGVKLIIITAAPFIAVSVIRRIINAPRPYEILGFYDEPPKKKRGRSFPSRHVFSSVSIGTVICFFEPWLGVIVISAGLAMGACRVLLGIHFIRDVVAGAVTGAAASVIGMLIVLYL